LEAVQEKKLKAILNHAYRNVPYYHRLFDSVGVRPEDIKNYSDLSKIPITTKSQLKNAKKEIIARNIDLNKCVKCKTSGSTGIPLTLPFSKEDAMYAKASYERVRIENGFRLFRDVLLNVGSPYSIPKGKKWYQHLRIHRSEGLNVFESLDAQINILKKVKPDAIWGYPSTIKLLAKAVQEKDVKKISPKLIFTASEVLDPETRDFINSIFNVDLFDVYGAYETGCMAWECDEHAGYHMSMDTVLMEFINEKGEHVNTGERGKVVVTNLYSYAMPIIRYEIGDFAIPTDEECSCGRGGYLMKTIEGRCDDFLVLPSGKIISPRNINLFEYVNGITSYKIIQEKRDKFTVLLVKAKDFSQETITEVKEIIKMGCLGECEDINIEVEIVDEIPRDPSGKIRAVISKV
jgi:phenylacetate-CoA ligase